MNEHRKRWRTEAQGTDDRVRYCDLPPDVKRDKRQLERQEKKEKERTFKYFQSVQRALEEHASGAGDPSTLAAIVDGFFVELIKLLKADRSLHLLRNDTICRVIESALANSLLLHSKSLLYVLLGHVADVAASPTASYTLETLLVSIVQALGAMAEDNADAFAAEMFDGGIGSDAGSGVPSAATLVTCVVDELSERAADILFHEVAARAVRSVVLVLGGLTIRGAPPLARPVAFPRQLRVLGDSLLCAVEHAFRDPSSGPGGDGAGFWLSVAATPTASFIVQSLLRAMDPAASPLHRQIADPALLRQLLLDAMGCHIFQAFTRAPVRSQEAQTEAEAPVEDSLSCWDAAMNVFVAAADALLDPAADRAAQASYALQDLSLFAPSPAHVALLWERALRPRLSRLLAEVALAPALAAFARKCAFGSSDTAAAAAGGLPADMQSARRAEEASGARFFAAPLALQKDVTAALCLGARELSAKGAAQYLLVDGGLRERGYEIARCVLLFSPAAASMFVHAMDKLRLEDIAALARQARGSAVLQQYIRAGSALSVTRPAQKGERAARPMSLRFLRRIAPLLQDFVGDTCAAFVVEVLYEVAPLEVKEELVQLLVPIYNAMRHGGSATTQAENDSANHRRARDNADNTAAEADGVKPAASGDSTRDFIARKVMTKCCVELYVHRREDWTKVAHRQCQVQKLVYQMSAIET